MMPSDPDRPGAEETGDDRTRPASQRPLSRGDLFGPGGPFQPADAADDDATVAYGRGEDPTVAHPPADGPDRTRAFRPQPEITPPTAHGPYPQPGPYEPGYDQGYDPAGYTPGQYQQPPPGPGRYGAAGYEPGQYQPGDPRNPYGGGGDPYGYGAPPPRRNRTPVVVALVVLAVGVVAAGLVYVLFGGDPDGTSTAGPSTSASATPKAGDTTAADEGDDQPTPTPTGEKTDPADYEPIPDEPWTDDSLDFGLLTAVRERGGEVQLTVNRASFYYGDEAKRKNGGKDPENDYLIEDTNPRLRTFVLRKDSPVNGSTRLANAGADGKDLELGEFVSDAQAALGQDKQGIPVWLRHEGNDQEGPVTALKEQFLP